MTDIKIDMNNLPDDPADLERYADLLKDWALEFSRNGAVLGRNDPRTRLFWTEASEVFREGETRIRRRLNERYGR